MTIETSLPTLILYPRRGVGLVWFSAAAILLAVASGGLLASVMGGGFASLSSFFYIALLAFSYLGLHRGWRRLSRSLQPVVELNNEEIVLFDSDLRISWASIVDVAQRRVNGRWVIAIRYLDEEDPDRIELHELPLTGYNIPAQRVGREIRRRFEEVDAGDDHEA